MSRIVVIRIAAVLAGLMLVAGCSPGTGRALFIENACDSGLVVDVFWTHRADEVLPEDPSVVVLLDPAEGTVVELGEFHDLRVEVEETGHREEFLFETDDEDVSLRFEGEACP